LSDQATNNAIGEESQLRVVEIALRAATSASDNLLSKILILLLILVAGLLTVFGYYASSICITVALAGFLAILFDPVVVLLEKLHLPRGVAAAGIVLAGIGLIGLLGYVLYGRAMSFAEELPVYASKIQQTVEPISRKIQELQQSAGSLTNGVHPIKKVPEVRFSAVHGIDTGAWQHSGGYECGNKHLLRISHCPTREEREYGLILHS